jgi:hypothetical protein
MTNTTDVTDRELNNNESVEQPITNKYQNRETIAVPRSNDHEMQKLIQRLVPYSQSLQGTAPHIAFERTKLMAMIPSPIMKKIGSCRWFLTMAPSDKYEIRTIEVMQDAIIDDSISA